MSKLYLFVPYLGAIDFFKGKWSYLQNVLKEKNIELIEFSEELLLVADKVIFYNVSPGSLHIINKYKITKDKLILICYEPKTVLPFMYSKTVLSKFYKVLTWRDDLVGNNFFKIYYLQGQEYDKIAIKNRKRFILINANKNSYEKNELYSKRREIIEYFEESNEIFDLYGHNWDKKIIKNPKQFLYMLLRSIKNKTTKRFIYETRINMKNFHYNNYRGVVDDKHATLNKYEYCFCFENEISPGYITEKIFDCFFSGTIPIYLGATNICNYIPSKAFIDYRDFSSIDLLLKYLESLTKKEMEDIVLSGENFIKSEMFKTKWYYKAALENIAKILLDEK